MLDILKKNRNIKFDKNLNKSNNKYPYFCLLIKLVIKFTGQKKF